jgi:hypothetical protein
MAFFGEDYRLLEQIVDGGKAEDYQNVEFFNF